MKSQHDFLSTATSPTFPGSVRQQINWAVLLHIWDRAVDHGLRRAKSSTPGTRGVGWTLLRYARISLSNVEGLTRMDKRPGRPGGYHLTTARSTGQPVTYRMSSRRAGCSACIVRDESSGGASVKKIRREHARRVQTKRRTHKLRRMVKEPRAGPQVFSYGDCVYLTALQVAQRGTVGCRCCHRKKSHYDSFSPECRL